MGQGREASQLKQKFLRMLLSSQTKNQANKKVTVNDMIQNSNSI